MTIGISNLTVSDNAPAGTTVGVLTTLDAFGNAISCNYTLAKNSVGYFAISGTDVVTAWNGSAVPGNYYVRLHASGINTAYSGKATFTIRVTTAAAQPPAPPPAPPPPRPSYTGPGDVLANATVFYGLRGYNQAYATPGTNPAINVRRASDNTVRDIAILPNGAVDVATAASFGSGTTLYIVTWYDQTGTGNHCTQPNISLQPKLVFNAIGSLPALRFASNAPTYLENANGVTAKLPFTWSLVANSDVALNVFSFYQDSEGGGWAGFGPLINGAAVYVGGNYGNQAGAAITQNVYSAVQTVITSGGNMLVYVNGTANNMGVTGQHSYPTGAFTIGAASGHGAGYNGYYNELVLWPIQLSSSQIAALTANQRAYYRF
jgi:hypothetical protein